MVPCCIYDIVHYFTKSFCTMLLIQRRPGNQPTSTAHAASVRISLRPGAISRVPNPNFEERIVANWMEWTALVAVLASVCTLWDLIFCREHAGRQLIGRQ